jgi:hypothetical protein
MGSVTMSLLLLALLAQPDLSETAFDHYRDFMKSAPAIEARFTVRQASGPAANATMLLQRGSKVRLDSKWRDSDYSFVTTKGGLMRELERSSRMYDEMEVNAPYAFPASEISSTPEFVLPFFIGSTDLRDVFGPNSKKTPLGPSTIDGNQVHGVRFEVMTQLGMEYGEFALKEDGTLVEARRYSRSADNRDKGRIWRFDSIKSIPSIPAERMELDIPNGYVPYRLPDVPGPLAIGQPFPFAGWTGGPALKKGSRTLYALIGEDCPPGEASLPALKDLGAAGLKVVVLSEAANAASAKGRYYDPSGKSLDALMAPATPVYYLVGSDGKVQRLWMGYDPAKRKAWVSEIKAALKESATK